MNKRQQLEQYLDSQLKRVEGGEETGALRSFDKLEEKLDQIERKLVRLKDQNIMGTIEQPHQSKVQKQVKRRMVQATCQYDIIPSKSNRNTEQHLKISQAAQITPQKQLNIISKTMSDGYFNFNANSHQKSKRKKYDSEVKTAKTKEFKNSEKSNKKSIKSLNATVKKPARTLFDNGCSPKKLFTKRQASLKKLNRTHDTHLINLQKDIDICLKSNAQLKKKITHLQGYKAQYCKLKDFFQKCEKIRKKNRS